MIGPSRTRLIVSTLLVFFLQASRGFADAGPTGQPAREVKNDGAFSFDSAFRYRLEYVDWYHAKDKPSNDPYLFEHTKLNLGAKFHQDFFTAYAQGQYFQLLDLPDSGTGTGANYNLNNEGKRNPGGVILRQAYLAIDRQIGTPLLRAAGGRMLYANGMEIQNSSPEIEAIKKNRIANRVLGSFDFTAGRSFDGGLVSLSEKSFGGVAGGFFHPTQGGFSADGGVEITHIDIGTASATYGQPILGTASEAQLFYYYYDDNRDNTTKVDNRPLELRQSELSAIEIHNVGAHWIESYKLDEVAVDTLFWGILQSGRWGSDNVLAGAFAAESGLSFPKIACTPALRFGYWYGSGDSNPGDKTHSTFFQMFPTGRQYALSPFYNMMNNQDTFAELEAIPADDWSTHFGLHFLQLSSVHDLFYSGSGANLSEGQFGYSGLPVYAKTIGLLLDSGVSYRLNSYLGASLYYGHLFPGGSFEDQLGSAEVDYGFLEINAKY